MRGFSGPAELAVCAEHPGATAEAVRDRLLFGGEPERSPEGQSPARPVASSALLTTPDRRSTTDGDARRYVFVCLNQHPWATPRAPAWTGGGRRVQRPAQGAAPALLTNVKVVAAGCMEGCLAGPGPLLLTPDNG